MLRSLFVALIRYSFIPDMIRETFQKDKVTMLLYHDIEAVLFDQHLTELAKHYNFISLRTYLEAREDSGITLPPKSLIITFDDGWKSNYDLLPALKKHNVTATIFLCTSIVNTCRKFWFSMSKDGALNEHLKDVSFEEQKKILQKYGFDIQKEYEDRETLNHAEIMEMAPWVDFQSHTCYHSLLPQCETAWAQKEVFDSRQQMKDLFGIESCALSYPNGDYSLRDIELLKRAGYTLGVAVDYYYNTRRTDPYRIKRINIRDRACVREAVIRASGFWAFFYEKLGRKKFGFKKKAVGT